MPQRVYGDMDFAAFLALDPIVAGRGLALRLEALFRIGCGLQHAPIENSRRRLWVLVQGHTQHLAQVTHHRNKAFGFDPADALLVDSGPRRQIIWKHVPRCAGAHYPPQAAENFEHRMLALGYGLCH